MKEPVIVRYEPKFPQVYETVFIGYTSLYCIVEGVSDYVRDRWLVEHETYLQALVGVCASPLIGKSACNLLLEDICCVFEAVGGTSTGTSRVHKRYQTPAINNMEKCIADLQKLVWKKGK
jgi:hypothetical protein